jgi:hypothetical protein
MSSYQSQIDSCLACTVACERCVTDCIVSNRSECAKLCRDCADICDLSARLTARNSQFSSDLRALCAMVCKACASECDKHAMHHDSCKQCAEACRKCAADCSVAAIELV